MKMSELINELSERIEIYGDATIVLRDSNDFDKTEEIFDVFFNEPNKEFVIVFQQKVIFNSFVKLTKLIFY